MSSLHQIANAIRDGASPKIEDCRQTDDGWSIVLDFPFVRYCGYVTREDAREELRTARKIVAK